MQKLVKKIQESIQPYFVDHISIYQDGFGIYRLTSNNLSDAKDLHKNYFDDIKVVKWINDYWIKITINLKRISTETTFKSGKNGINKEDYQKSLKENNLKLDKYFFETNISLSLFKGGYDIFSKYQLFRAEWDNFDKKQEKHPQPHWQFYQLNEYSQKLNKLANEQFNTIDKDDGFLDSLKTNFDFKKFHFAMNGNWINNESEIHSLNNEEKIVKWFQGLLSHIKVQLEYVNNK